MIYKNSPEKVNWKAIKEIFKEYEIEIKSYELIMKDCYGEFIGEDWKIAVAQLIESLQKFKKKDKQDKSAKT